MKLNYALRLATDADYAFLYDLHTKTMKAPVEKTWGWDEAFQKTYFREHFTTSNVYVIMIDDQPAGKFSYRYEADGITIFLAEIEILPEFQGKGLGTTLIRTLIDEASAKHSTVRLQVLKANPDARRLYERLGFKIYSETEPSFLMRWSDSPILANT